MYQQLYETQLDRFKESFLLAAARGGRIDEVASLIDLGAKVDILTEDQLSSPLSEAICGNHVEVVSLLLANGADPRRSVAGGNNALHLAVQTGNEDVCALFLTMEDCGDIIRSLNESGQTPFDIAVEKGHLGLAQQLNNISETADELEMEDTNGSVSASSDLEGNEIRDRFLSNLETDSFGPSDVSESFDQWNESSRWSQEDSLDTSPQREESRESENKTSCQLLQTIQEIKDENAILKETERVAKLVSSNTEKALSALERKCDRLQRERDDAIREIDEVLNGVNMCNKSMEDLIAYETRLRSSLELVMLQKGKLTETRLAQEEEKRFCVVCQAETKTVLLMPCRHLCVCKECSMAEQLDRCPLCRQHITDKIYVYS